MGLSLVLDADVNDYSVTNGKFDGFKVIGFKNFQFDLGNNKNIKFNN